MTGAELMSASFQTNNHPTQNPPPLPPHRRPSTLAGRRVTSAPQDDSTLGHLAVPLNAGDTGSMKSMSEPSSSLTRLQEDERAPPLINRVREGGSPADTKALIRTLLLQPLRPTYSQAITFGSPSAGPLVAERYCSASCRSAGATRKSW